jgi:hypothetical protein
VREKLIAALLTQRLLLRETLQAVLDQEKRLALEAEQSIRLALLATRPEADRHV